MEKRNTIKILNTTPVCENFWGNGAIYHCFAEMPDENNRKYSPQLAELEADRVQKLGLKFVRTYYSYYGYDKEKGCWTWETPECRALYAWLDRMQQRGIAVALNVGWWCPGDINGTSGVKNNPIVVAGNWKKSVLNYADFVSETVHQLIEIRNFKNIKVLTLFTEPGGIGNNGAYTPDMQGMFSPENGPFQWQVWQDCVTAASAALKRDGRRGEVLLMGPNESTETSEMLKWTVEQQIDMDILSSHTYQINENAPEHSGIPKNCKDEIPQINKPGGRIFQRVALQKNKNYRLKIKLLWCVPDALQVSGYVLFGAFSTACGTINSGREPTNRLSPGSTQLVEPPATNKALQCYELVFHSGNSDRAFIGVYFDVKQLGANVVVCEASLTEENGSKELLQNNSFQNGFDAWQTFYAGGRSDWYGYYYNCCKTALSYVPKNKYYIWDEYNCIFRRDNCRLDHGANVVSFALALMNAGANGSMLWSLFDQQWPNSHCTNGDSFVDGDHRCGLAPLLTRSRIPHRSYYAFGLLSKFTGGWGSKVYRGVGAQKLHTTMNALPDGNMTIVVVNNKETPDAFDLLLEQPLHRQLKRYVFQPATLIPNEQAKLSESNATFMVEDAFSDKIEAFSVTVYSTL